MTQPPTGIPFSHTFWRLPDLESRDLPFPRRQPLKLFVLAPTLSPNSVPAAGL